jgi:hypothetical protein
VQRVHLHHLQVIVAAGYDAAEGDPLGGCKLTPEVCPTASSTGQSGTYPGRDWLGPHCAVCCAQHLFLRPVAGYGVQTKACIASCRRLACNATVLCAAGVCKHDTQADGICGRAPGAGTGGWLQHKVSARAVLTQALLCPCMCRIQYGPVWLPHAPPPPPPT